MMICISILFQRNKNKQTKKDTKGSTIPKPPLCKNKQKENSFTLQEKEEKEERLNKLETLNKKKTENIIKQNQFLAYLEEQTKDIKNFGTAKDIQDHAQFEKIYKELDIFNISPRESELLETKSYYEKSSMEIDLEVGAKIIKYCRPKF